MDSKLLKFIKDKDYDEIWKCDDCFYIAYKYTEREEKMEKEEKMEREDTDEKDMVKCITYQVNQYYSIRETSDRNIDELLQELKEKNYTCICSR